MIETLTEILAGIEAAKKHSPLASAQVDLLAASKTQSGETIEKFIQAGVMHFGENRVQEAKEKWPDLKAKYPHVKLHLIGPLQTNKVEDALALFDVIQTLDRPKLADAIAVELKQWRNEELKKEEKPSVPHFLSSSIPQFYIQVNTGKEPQKAGISPQEAPEFIRYCRDLKLKVVGLMCVPPVGQMPAPHFAILKRIADSHGLAKLSMGMSSDYETAIRMGSTCVRIGTALFGMRHYA